ncbi:hypothetical protein ANN_24340 [Periplaneta americana]|uniref:Uncharacterized protein n=1 Tax=Periplaneta americana TaxID=6978 RepID=A0ABQ8S2T2_PERAM|nr:hypothetical protein ANN_24340 [Periplaneta americana]
MAGLCEGGSEPAGFLKVICKTQPPAWLSRLRRLPAGVKLHSGADYVDSIDNYLLLNPNKCCFMTYSKNKTIAQNSFEINGVKLLGVESFKVLGIYFAHKLCFKMHLNHVAVSWKDAIMVNGALLNNQFPLPNTKRVTGSHGAEARALPMFVYTAFPPIARFPRNKHAKRNKLGATVTNINDTREEIKRRINMGNACYYSVEKLLSSILLSKNLKVRIYKTVILPVVLYSCETWTLALREEHRLRVFENKVLRKIFRAKRDEVTGEWRKLHNAELHALYPSPDIIRNIKSRRLRWAGHVVRMGESRNAYRVLVGRPEGKRPLGRPRRRWEDNIKMDLREVGYDDRDWINLALDRDRWRAYVRAAMNLRVP